MISGSDIPSGESVIAECDNSICGADRHGRDIAGKKFLHPVCKSSDFCLVWCIPYLVDEGVVFSIIIIIIILNTTPSSTRYGIHQTRQKSDDLHTGCRNFLPAISLPCRSAPQILLSHSAMTDSPDGISDPDIIVSSIPRCSKTSLRLSCHNFFSGTAMIHRNRFYPDFILFNTFTYSVLRISVRI